MFTLPSDNFAKDKLTPYRCSLLVLIKEYALLYDGKNKNYPRMIWQDGESLFFAWSFSSKTFNIVKTATE